MSKIIYYIGAGASYGTKDAREILEEGTENERLIVREGLPVVSEIALCLKSFKIAVENAEIDPNQFYVFNNKYQQQGDHIIETQKRLIEDIDELYKATKEHATIDTYAKKLYLTNKENKLKKLKDVLCIFFVWAQIEGKTDPRYDTFLANILQNNLALPKVLSIISWNYDSQFEIAYNSYSKERSLPIYDKNADGDYCQSNDNGKIFKVNGSANIEDSNLVNKILKETDIPSIIQLIEYYKDLYTDTQEFGYRFHSHLSFAWEKSEKQNQLMEEIRKTTADTETVVVIGYSFPFFNREIDRQLLSNMRNLKRIYIQCPNPMSVESSLRATLPENNKIIIEHISDCSQFYLPRDL